VLTPFSKAYRPNERVGWHERVDPGWGNAQYIQLFEKATFYPLFLVNPNDNDVPIEMGVVALIHAAGPPCGLWRFVPGAVAAGFCCVSDFASTRPSTARVFL
jgi:hypothetical protein